MLGTFPHENLLVQGAELRQCGGDFGVFPAVEVGGDLGLGERFGKAAFEAQELRQRPVRLEPVWVGVDRVTQRQTPFSRRRSGRRRRSPRLYHASNGSSAVTVARSAAAVGQLEGFGTALTR